MPKHNKGHGPKSETGIAVTNGRFSRILLDGFRPYAWLLLAIALVYGQAVKFGFIGFDDVSLISRQAGQPFNFSQIMAAFRENAFGAGQGLFFYRPLLTLSLMVDSVLGGGRPGFFHLSNLLFHLAAVWLAFGLFVKLKYIRPAAFAAAMIVAVHPALASAVTWVPGRNDSMLAVWVLAAMLSLILFRETGKIRYLVAQGICFMAALFTKETALAFPLVALGYVFLLGEKSIEKPAKILWPVSVWLSAILIWHLARSMAMMGYGPFPLSLLSPRDILATLISIFGRLGLPLNLTLVRDVNDINLVYGLISLVVLTLVTVFWGVKNKRAFGFGWMWFGLFLLPGLSLAGDSNAFLDHRLYLPLIGFLVFLLELKIFKLSAWGKTARLAGFLLAILLGSVSFVYSRSFKDDLSCWAWATKNSPNSAVAHNALGLAYSKRNNFLEAEKEYLAARQRSKRFVRAGYNLGILYLKKGRLEKAGQMFQEVLAIRPDLAGANYNLGVVYQRKGDEDSALVSYQRELRYDPKNVGALTGIGTIYHQRGDLDQALTSYQKAVEINGSNSDVLVNLASLYQQKGNFPEAEQLYLRALKIIPGSAEAHYNLGKLYQKQKRRQESEIELNKAYSLRPYLKSIK